MCWWRERDEKDIGLVWSGKGKKKGKPVQRAGARGEWVVKIHLREKVNKTEKVNIVEIYQILCMNQQEMSRRHA